MLNLINRIEKFKKVLSVKRLCIPMNLINRIESKLLFDMMYMLVMLLQCCSISLLHLIKRILKV